MSEQISFRFGKEKFTKEDLDSKADKLDISRSALIKKAIKTILEFDNDFIEKMDKIADSVNLTFSEVLQGFVTKRLAEIDAKKEVWGSSILLDELIRTEEGVPNQRRLYKWLKDDIKKKEEKKKINELLDRESKGISLTDSQKEFLIKNKVGQAYLNSEQYKHDKNKKEAQEELQELNQKALDDELTEKDEEQFKLLKLKSKNLLKE